MRLKSLPHSADLHLIESPPSNDNVLIPFTGDSMQTFLIPGDLLHVRTFPKPVLLNELADFVSLGDLVLFQSAGMWVVHRVISPSQTKGDRSTCADQAPILVWGRLEALTRKEIAYAWGNSPMIGQMWLAKLSRLSMTKIRPLRWLYLVFLHVLSVYSLSRYRT